MVESDFWIVQTVKKTISEGKVFVILQPGLFSASIYPAGWVT